MSIEPLRSHTRTPLQRSRNPYEDRWRWWYSSIADIMIRSPGVSQGDIAKELDKAPNTISMIINTDLFQEYLARRKEAWRKEHDFTILSKVQRVAELSMDSVVAQLEKKKDQIPLPLAVEAMNSALDRLGYGTPPPAAVAVNVQQNDNRTQTVIVQGVSASALEEARAALRLAEAKRGEDFDGRLARPRPTPLINDDTILSPSPLGDSATSSRSEVNEEQGVFDLKSSKGVTSL